MEGSALYQRFVTELDELAEPLAQALAAEAEAVTAALVAQWTAARAAWPALSISGDELAGELARRLASHADAGAALAALAQARGADIYLAIACCRGAPHAIAQLDELLARELHHAQHKLRASADQSAEVHAELRRILLVDEPGRRAALRDYAGRGDLRGYLRVMATRALIRAINRGRRELAVDDHALFDRMLPADDAELTVLRAHYRDTVDAALRAALAGLDDRARALLRYQLIDGWSIDRVGVLYGVHRATAARWLAEARAALGEAIRAELACRLQIATGEVASIVRLVQSRVDLSLERLLSPVPIAPSRATELP